MTVILELKIKAIRFNSRMWKRYNDPNNSSITCV